MGSFLHRWQPGLGHAVRIQLLIAAGLLHPAILWFGFFSNIHRLMLGSHTAFGYDFVTFWNGATLALDGRAAVVLDPVVFPPGAAAPDRRGTGRGGSAAFANPSSYSDFWKCANWRWLRA